MGGLDALAIIKYFYQEDTPLRRMLILHSTQVRDKAVAIFNAMPNPAPHIDINVVMTGAMLHDIGIGRCNAPKILCLGTQDYIAHGVVGAAMLRKYAAEHGLNLETYARICERHTGSGITAGEVIKQNLHIPVKDYLPETPEEKLICLADKFYSKSGNMQEKPLDKVRKSLAKFGGDSADRFDEICKLFDVHDF